MKSYRYKGSNDAQVDAERMPNAKRNNPMEKMDSRKALLHEPDKFQDKLLQEGKSKLFQREMDKSGKGKRNITTAEVVEMFSIPESSLSAQRKRQADSRTTQQTGEHSGTIKKKSRRVPSARIRKGAKPLGVKIS